MWCKRAPLEISVSEWATLNKHITESVSTEDYSQRFVVSVYEPDKWALVFVLSYVYSTVHHHISCVFVTPAVLGDLWLWHDESQRIVRGHCGRGKGSERHWVSHGFKAEDREEVPASAVLGPVDGGRLGRGERGIIMFVSTVISTWCYL